MSRHSPKEIERIKRVAAKMTPNSLAQGSFAATPWLACPFCSMPNIVEAVLNKDAMAYAAECPDCHACGPLEKTPAAALEAWKRRAHDFEWRYRKGRALADRWCDAIGQNDETKRENLAISIAEDLAG